MNPTVRFHRILQRAEQIAKDNGLDCIDSYCITKAMLDGTEYNMCYLTFLRLGINIDQFVTVLDEINNQRGQLTQHHNTPDNEPHPEKLT